MRNISVLAAALAAAVSMGEIPQSAEVVPRPQGLGDWVRRNNRRRLDSKWYGRPKVQQQRQRLQRATGPGSYDEWKSELAAARAAKRASDNGS